MKLILIIHSTKAFWWSNYYYIYDSFIDIFMKINVFLLTLSMHAR